MYEKETDAKVDELISLVKAMDTKLKFVMEDLEDIKSMVTSMGETVIQTAMTVSVNAEKASGEKNKASRLDAFREQTSRW
jgi:hypothetical protein